MCVLCVRFAICEHKTASDHSRPTYLEVQFVRSIKKKNTVGISSHYLLQSDSLIMLTLVDVNMVEPVLGKRGVDKSILIGTGIRSTWGSGPEHRSWTFFFLE